MNYQQELNNVNNRVIENERILLALGGRVAALEGAASGPVDTIVTAQLERAVQASNGLLDNILRRLYALENVAPQESPPPQPVEAAPEAHAEQPADIPATADETAAMPTPAPSPGESDPVPVADFVEPDPQHVDDVDFTVDPNAPISEVTEERP